jgi:hypothetical protein
MTVRNIFLEKQADLRHRTALAGWSGRENFSPVSLSRDLRDHHKLLQGFSFSKTSCHPARTVKTLVFSVIFDMAG